MIKNILELLKADDWKDSTDVIRIAKGEYHLPKTFGQLKRKIKRIWHLKK